MVSFITFLYLSRYIGVTYNKERPFMCVPKITGCQHPLVGTVNRSLVLKEVGHVNLGSGVDEESRVVIHSPDTRSNFSQTVSTSIPPTVWISL
jgi:hypothetical protein